MKKLLILVLTNFFIISLILLGKPAKAQTTTITGQFLYGLQLYVLPEKQTPPDYSTAIYSSTIDENDFITSGLYENWCQPRLPDGINGYIYLVDSSHTIGNVYLGGGYLEQGQTLSYPYEPSIEMKHYNAPLITIFILNPVNKGYFESYGGRLDHIVYHENNDGSTPRIKLIDATTNENDYNRVKLAINGYDTGYNAGYSIGYNNGQVNGYNSGYEDGQNNGYSAGYNAGQYDFYNEYYDEIYNRGYKAGVDDAEQPGYVAIQYYNQFVDNLVSDKVVNGITFTNNQDGTITLNGTCISQIGDNSIGESLTTTATIHRNNHKILISLGLTDVISGFYFGVSGYTIRTYRRDFIFIQSNISDWSGYIACSINEGTTLNNLKLRPIIVDLTQMYGEGNEPSIEQCYQIFTAYSYPYSTGEVVNVSYINGYETGKSDGFSIGYDDGKSYQATQQLTTDGWITNIFTGIGSFLAIEILPGVSIGLIVGIPFIITVAWFVLKMARGGSSE